MYECAACTTCFCAADLWACARPTHCLNLLVVCIAAKHLNLAPPKPHHATSSDLPATSQLQGILDTVVATSLRRAKAHYPCHQTLAYRQVGELPPVLATAGLCVREDISQRISSERSKSVERCDPSLGKSELPPSRPVIIRPLHSYLAQRCRPHRTPPSPLPSLPSRSNLTSHRSSCKLSSTGFERGWCMVCRTTELLWP